MQMSPSDPETAKEDLYISFFFQMRQIGNWFRAIFQNEFKGLFTDGLIAQTSDMALIWQRFASEPYRTNESDEMKFHAD